mmetsp:Transcript_6052/g.7834  ORF Transcript_6052/g.7834 Transcript_6052/m.7834 type:complete len:201 (+) Transcript_6052:53-655(+)|eukprot:CAMPEP_0114353532 /NCGR_PEP_ID=MMETSP0101-20121206/18733_1 /TAXON_ID=38822 ORGANISM="Pteridomonas danica, Strain PT" /NCGR_SAMPLE_ID=MMETSP0101 /ASSEMBLY_ACC=CAM_ASM_000211 /LENGTH=200 /DNA_ID=CAMNT_0001494413 /DNA_START=35 /DNA_END=637 /DNA_ORIENTATION=-
MATVARRTRRNSKISQRRKTATLRFKEEQDRATRWVAQFDTDGSKTLDRTEFAKLMAHMNHGTEPTEAEITKVFRRADYRKTGDLDSQEIIIAVSKWKAMLDEREFIDGLFAKFDVDKSGVVDKVELKALLTDMNDNEPPTEDEIDDIIFRVDTDNNGTINRDELQPAIETWFIDRELLKQEEKENQNKTRSRSSLCSIM